MNQANEHCNQGPGRLTFFCATALSAWLWADSSQAQGIKVPTNLGPQYGRIAQYASRVRQTDNVKSFSAQIMNPAIFRVKMSVPYEFDQTIDLDLLVDCSNGRIARTQGLLVADSRFEAAYYSFIIRRTCN